MTVMTVMRRHVLVGVALLFLGCGGEGEAIRSDANQFVTREGDGQIRFYLGDQVRKELRKSGRFLPAEGKRYQMVVVPERLVEGLSEVGASRFFSACKSEHGITIFNSIALDKSAAAEWQAERERLVDPYIRIEEHSLTEMYRSGDPGVYGFVSVSRGPAELSASAQIELLVAVGKGFRDGALLLGDPSLPPPSSGENCGAPKWPSGG